MSGKGPIQISTSMRKRIVNVDRMDLMFKQCPDF